MGLSSYVDDQAWLRQGIQICLKGVGMYPSTWLSTCPSCAFPYALLFSAAGKGFSSGENLWQQGGSGERLQQWGQALQAPCCWSLSPPQGRILAAGKGSSGREAAGKSRERYFFSGSTDNELSCHLSPFLCLIAPHQQFDYYNSLLINEKDGNDNYVELGDELILEPNEHFNNLLVNTTYSDVQLPTNVYNKDPDILNGVYMSEALNPIFVDNFQRDPTLTWQYFGSSTGFFRLYPGIKWMPDENGVISFDCRNRGWYIQAATSPKDVIIVVDISGSMKGLRMTIAKYTIITILDTLGENDFVNIIAYNDYVHYVEPCFKGILVQADRDNREHFKQLVDELQAKGVGTVNKAVLESFKILREFREAGQGGLCNQAIMLITDGAVEDYESVFEKYNWPDRKVRVFTYLIGREVTFAENVKWIACNNKGYYTQISTLADVQENVMEYLHVLSRPMVINHDHDIIWTEAYMDSALFASQAQSLLLMTTVAMPVFSKKNETRSHGILLGVVGSDVPLRELLKLAPRYKLGVHGYAFLNTNNGYILSHPDLRPLYREGKKLKPKPNYNSVDLSEVEWEDQDEIVSIRNGLYLGVVLSRGHGEYILLGNTSVEEDHYFPGVIFCFSFLAARIYCITDIDPDHRKLSQLEAMIRFLTGEEPDLECDEDLVQEVLFDAVVTAPMEAYWTALALNMSDETEQGVETAFLGTRAGLMRSLLYVGSEKLLNRQFLTLGDKESIFTMDHFPLWYRRAAEHPPGSFIYSITSEEGSGNPHLSTTAKEGDGENKFVTLSPLLPVPTPFTFIILFLFTSRKLRNFITDISLFPFIALSVQIGKFFGEVDGSVMTQLLNMGMFRQPALCLCSPILVSDFISLFAIAAHKHKKHDMLQPCDTEYPVFVYENTIKETNGLIECGDCQKMFVAQQIANSNLLLLVTDAACDCSVFPPVLLEAKEVKYILLLSQRCDRMRSQKLRRRPDTCHAFHPEWGCTGGKSIVDPTALRGCGSNFWYWCMGL
uniref:Calcium voltage-gated channel auxiliary subunit alpha2delta 4 n=1 Tax=Chelydra serpentina TaxID=8475 RepID=A0A8C3TAB6_CHESE